MEDYAILYLRDGKATCCSFSIIFFRGTQFTFTIWKSFQKGLGSRVKISMTFILKLMGKEHNVETL